MNVREYRDEGNENHAAKPRILCIVDAPEWIFHRHSMMLDRYLSDDFIFSTSFRGQDYDENDYDLIYPLEYDMVVPEQIKQPIRYVTGIRSLIAWAEWDFLKLVEYLATHFNKLHVVSKELFDIFSPYFPDIQYVTHGVDTEFFSAKLPPNLEAGRLRLGWAGNRSTIVKGFRDYILPLGSLPGVELVYCGFIDEKKEFREMPDFYDSIDAYICTSSFEGNNNSILEAASMERAIVTTAVGTVPEYLENNHSALIIERNLESIQSAIITLRDHPELRVSIGKNARKALINGGWDWKVKAEDYRNFFHLALNFPTSKFRDLPSVRPKNYRHYAEVINKQFILVRELRIDYTLQTFDLQNRLTKTEQDNNDLRQSLVDSQQIIERINQELHSTQQELSIKEEESIKSHQELEILEQSLASKQDELNSIGLELENANHNLSEILLEQSKLDETLHQAQFEIAEIKNSETYRLAEYVKSLRFVKAIIWLYKKLIS